MNYKDAPDAAATQKLVQQLRDLPKPDGVRVLVGGGNDDLSDNIPGTQSVPFDANGIAAHPNGNLVFYVGQQPARVRVLARALFTREACSKTSKPIGVTAFGTHSKP